MLSIVSSGPSGTLLDVIDIGLENIIDLPAAVNSLESPEELNLSSHGSQR